MKRSPEGCQTIMNTSDMPHRNRETELTEVVNTTDQGMQVTRLRTLDTHVAQSTGRGVDCSPPVWWFQHFDPSWAPLRKWFRWKKSLTLQEFRLVTAHVSGLTSIEKTIAVAAFVASKNIQ